MFVVRGERVVLPNTTGPASVIVRDGRVVGIEDYHARPVGVPAIEAGEHLVLPGFVDTHVHVNDPGRASWEGFEHATRAAAAGGVTTIVDMPLNSIPATTSAAALFAKRVAAADRCHVDVGFWGGVVPGNADDLAPLARDGVLGFKCFLSPSGVDEFGHVTEQELRAAAPTLAALDLPLLVHAEAPALLVEPTPASDPRSYRTWLETRPAASEQAAIEFLLDLAAEFGLRVHIVHLASADAIAAIRQARGSGVDVTVETCPHYLSFAADEIPDGATAFKCAPPIRDRRHREELWEAVRVGDIDLIATDHSPAPPAMKGLDDGDFLRAWGGVASLQLGFSAAWTQAAARGVPLEAIVRCLSEAPARLAGLEGRKGRIAVGGDADLVICDPDADWVVDPLALLHRHPNTPYAGRSLRGRILTTLLRGEVVFADGRCHEAAAGRLLAPNGA
jgi:allantoinase